jgi:translocation and assembly module TamB
MEIDATAEAAPRSRLRLFGDIDGPLFAPGRLALRAEGRLDTALLDPLLTGGGRQLSGQATLATAITGTFGAPRLDGSLRLTDAALHDRTLGLALTDIDGMLALAGDAVRVDRLTARAGPGSIRVDGSIGLLVPGQPPGLPVDLRLVARAARPIQSDMLELHADADLRLHGTPTERPTLAGKVLFSRIDLRLPDRLPANIVTLQVRERGQRRSGNPLSASPEQPWRPQLGLDLLLSAPRAVQVQGRGVDAELGGDLRVRGTLAAPAIDGGLDLIRGQYQLVGQTLRFTSGQLGFDGATGLDPTIDLEARVSVAGSTAILSVLGTAGAPRIALRGEPEMPQDEVLSRLLFGVAGGRLSPLQATRLGLAAASLAGIGEGGGRGVLERARAGLGLNRLSIGTDERGDAVLEGGRNLTDRIYLGARQGTRTGEPQGVARIEVTPKVRLEADVGVTGGTRAGVAYEREY